MIAAVVAVDEHYAIGKDGKMLVSIRGDLKMFRELTSGHTVIMGRKTFDALPRGALPDRRNIVISSSAQNGCFEVEDDRGKYVLSSLEKVKEMLEKRGAEETLFIIGGGVIYKELLNYCQRAYVTKIFKVFDGADTYFPKIDVLTEWHKTYQGDVLQEGEISYQLYIYDRK